MILKFNHNGTMYVVDVADVSDIPTKVSQLTNDSGFLTSAPVTSVNSKTGAVSLNATDVGAYNLSAGTVAVASDNLNTYTIPGTYFIDSSVTSSISNGPSTTKEYKLVVEVSGTHTIQQTATMDDGTIYVRNGDDSTSSWVWYGWKKLITNTDYASYTNIKSGSHNATFITPARQDYSTFYGLAKAAGDTTQSQSDNAVGVYTNEAKSAIKSMIGVNVDDVQINGTSILSNGIANIPKASTSNLGVITTSSSQGLNINASNGVIYINDATSAQIKAADSEHRPVTTQRQHEAVFYGLAKVAGDSTQSASSNAVGTYTTNAKSSIQNMLGISDGYVTKDSINDAGISARTYTNLFGGEFSVTTAAENDWLNPHARASVTGRISKHYVYRVTVNGTVYNLPCRLWWENQTGSSFKVYEYIGNIGLYIGSTSGVPGKKDNVNFLIISDLNNSESIDVLTTTAGSYTILVERVNETLKPLPRSLIYYDEYQPFEVNNNGGTYNGFSLGVNTLSNQRGTIALGYCNNISNEFAVAIGKKNIISGNDGIAIGYAHNISASMGVAFGSSNTVSGSSGVAFGDSTTANCNNMVAMGRHNVEANTIFPNWQNNTDYKKGDIVKGKWNTVTLTWICQISHKSVASGTFMDDVSSPNNEMQWKLAPSNGDTAFVVGNGSTKQDRSNAFKIDFAGNGFFGADVYVNCNADSTGGNKLATEDYVDTVVTVSDVQINGSSVLSGGVANIPIADDQNKLGVVKVNNSYGITVGYTGQLSIFAALSADIKAGTSNVRPITPSTQNQSVFYGLAKAAGDTTQASSSNTVGTYTDNAKSAIKSMLGVPNATYDLGKGIELPANANLNTYTTPGVYHADSSVISTLLNTPPTMFEFKLIVEQASDGYAMQTCIDEFGHFYTRIIDIAFNDSTEWIKMIREEDYATNTTAGVVIVDPNYGLYMSSVDPRKIAVNFATSESVKNGTNTSTVISAGRQHESVFYGLAKAAGDTTQSSSSNTVGTYTDNAKAAIRAMIGAEQQIYIGSGTPAGYKIWIDPDEYITDSEEVDY